jgi:hypothetical protein
MNRFSGARKRKITVFKWISLVGLIVFGVCTFSRDWAGTAKAGFTGPDVPTLGTVKGDFYSQGATLANGRTNIPLLVNDLLQIHATDYWEGVGPNDSPYAWDDFQLMAPAFQQAGIRLWLMLTPPAVTPAPTPYGYDYVAWAQQCATIAKQYPMVAGLTVDELASNTSFFTPSYLKSMMTAAHAIDPALSLMATCYYPDRTKIASEVRAGAIDGVIFPYRIQQNNTEYFQDTSQLAPEISSFRSFLDQQTALGHLSGHMPLVTMVYAVGLSRSSDVPTPSYVQTCLTIGLQSTAAGQANGVMTYCLPKDQQAFLDAAAHAYVTPEPGSLSLLGTGVICLMVTRLRASVRGSNGDGEAKPES